MSGPGVHGLLQRSFRAKSRDPVAKFRIVPRDPSASLRMTVLKGADGE
jgi:hypothetical protein